MNEVEKERFGLFRETNFQDAQIKKVSSHMCQGVDTVSDTGHGQSQQKDQ